MSDAPAPRQLAVLRFIDAHRSAHGHAPTVQEIAEHLRITSTNGVVDHLKALVKKGLITFTPRRARTLALTPAGWRYVGLLVLMLLAGCDAAADCAHACSTAGLRMASSTADTCTCLAPTDCDLYQRAADVCLDRVDACASLLTGCNAALTACETRGGGR